MAQENKEQECKKCGRVFGSVKCFDVDCPNNTPKIIINQEKELLLKDLSCRIPYGVIVNVSGISNVKLTSVSWYCEVDVDDGSTYLYPISEVKPYLFPLSSMTPKQKAELAHLTADIDGIFEQVLLEIEFYHRHHIDYRGLIEKGLAIDATNLDVY